MLTSDNFYENKDIILKLKKNYSSDHKKSFIQNFHDSERIDWLDKKTNCIYKIYNRSLPISSIYSQFRFLVHKGNAFRKLRFKHFLIGYKFGEFAFTRKPFYFPIKTKKKDKRR